MPTVLEKMTMLVCEEYSNTTQSTRRREFICVNNGGSVSSVVIGVEVFHVRMREEFRGAS